MPAIYPFDLPAKQLPQPTDRLSDGFLHALPAPAGLWLPSKLANAAADFTPLPQKNFGFLHGGITTTAGGWGTLGASWKLDGTSGDAAFANLNTTGLPYTFAAVAMPLAGQYRVLASRGGSADQHLYFLIDPSNVLWRWSDFNSGYTVTNGVWYCFVYTFDAATNDTNGTEKWYVNGNLVATRTGSVPSSINATIYLGASPSGGHYWAGNIALEAFWLGSAFSASQVSQLYNCLRIGEPFPLFQPQAVPMMLGSAAAPVITSPGWFIGGGMGSFIGCG